MDSFYGCTNQGSKEVRLIEAYSKRGYPVFIYGERGTGKGNLAQLLYSISLFADSPLYDIDMQLAGENAVTFIRRLYEEDPDKKATFHFKNIDKADTAVIKHRPERRARSFSQSTHHSICYNRLAGEPFRLLYRVHRKVAVPDTEDAQSQGAPRGHSFAGEPVYINAEQT